MLKNRKSARKSRKRRKAELSTLRAENKILREENEKLKEVLKVAKVPLQDTQEEEKMEKESVVNPKLIEKTPDEQLSPRAEGCMEAECPSIFKPYPKYPLQNLLQLP